MANPYFQFKQFTIYQDKAAMKVTTDACLFGAWVGNELNSLRSEFRNALDIGTGTGLLALLIAQKLPNFTIDAIETDKSAFEQATGNIADSPWKDQINAIHADARNYDYSKKYDLIISNPPFYEKEIESASKTKNIAHHSYELSLKEVLLVIQENLNPAGRFFLLLPYKRNREIKNLFRQYEFHLEKIFFVRQSVNHDFFRMMIMGSCKPNDSSETEIDEISITNEDKEYTNEFKELLKDYYLHL